MVAIDSPDRSPDTSPDPMRARAEADISTLERFAAELEAMYEAEKDALGAEDARAMYRLVRLSRYCAYRGRRLIAGAWDPRAYARGIWLLASHYIMEITNGHAISHGIYDDLPDSRLDSASYEWQTMVVAADWAVDHNAVHHPFTNEVGRDDDFGFFLFRVSGRQPWRPWHLAQPLLLMAMPLALTAYFPGFLAAARARFEKRAVWSRQTFAPVARKVLAQWRQNYLDEPLAAGMAAPKVLLGNWAAKLISNTYIMLMLGVEHHADEVLDFEPDPGEPREIFYLRQIMGSKNFHTSERHEDLYTLGVNIHTEHHLFPDMPVHRLRKLEVGVRALCERHGIPYNVEPWPRAIWGLVADMTRFALPIRTTRRRESRRAVFRSLVDDFRSSRVRARLRSAPSTAPAPAPTTHTLRLARSGRELPVRSDVTLLDALEQAGVAVPFGCRKGACKTCATRKLTGHTSLEKRRVRDRIELCVARPESDIELDL